MFYTLENIENLPKFEYNGFKLGEIVSVHDDIGRDSIGYLVSIEISDQLSYGVAFNHDELYVVAKGLKNIKKINTKISVTVNQISELLTSLIASIYMNQLEIYGTMTFNELDLDSLDMIDIITKVEYELDIDIDQTIISMDDSIDVLADKIFDTITL